MRNRTLGLLSPRAPERAAPEELGEQTSLADEIKRVPTVRAEHSRQGGLGWSLPAFAVLAGVTFGAGLFVGWLIWGL